MRPACRIGIHDWRTIPTARAGVTVHRCRNCPAFVRTTHGRGRRKKRHYLVGAALLSLAIWYVVIALGLTGHTKLLWGAEKVAHGVGHAARHIDRRIDRGLGAPPPPDYGPRGKGA